MKQVNAADPKHVAEITKKQKSQEVDSRNAWLFVLSTKQGQEILWEIMSYCNVFGTPYDNSGSKLYFNVGKQEVGRMVMSKIISADENALINMMAHNKDKKEKQ